MAPPPPLFLRVRYSPPLDALTERFTNASRRVVSWPGRLLVMAAKSFLCALTAMSCHSNKHGEVLPKKLFEASASIALANFSPANLSQLYLTHLAVDVERPELKLKLPPPLLHRATELHRKEPTSAQ